MKSRVMTRAWKIFKANNSHYAWSFSSSLERAWWVEKENVKHEARKAAEQAEKERLAKWWASDEYEAIANKPIEITQEAYDNFYMGCKYFGD